MRILGSLPIAVPPNDIALILSKSGDTIESIILAEHLLVRGAETWYVRFNKKGKLSSMLERGIVLRLKEEGDPWNIVPNNSTTVYLMLLQGLAIQIADSMNIQLHDFKINHPGGRYRGKIEGHIMMTDALLNIIKPSELNFILTYGVGDTMTIVGLRYVLEGKLVAVFILL
jgi:D-arabinose 5-phosphate isomerase GutQ